MWEADAPGALRLLSGDAYESAASCVNFLASFDGEPDAEPPPGTSVWDEWIRLTGENDDPSQPPLGEKAKAWAERIVGCDEPFLAFLQTEHRGYIGLLTPMWGYFSGHREAWTDHQAIDAAIADVIRMAGIVCSELVTLERDLGNFRRRRRRAA